MAVNRKRLQERAAKYRGWLLLDKKSPLLYRKELIYEGEWQKLNSDGEGIAFAVATNTLNHWKESLSALREAGIKTPLTKSHENWDLPENKLGEVTAAHVSENDAGLPSLFLDILFDDEKSRDIGLKGDVSIGSPPGVWFDGTGREWRYPLQHVASTNAPVIPGLETWQAIAASFSKTNQAKGSKMDLDELIAALGIEVDKSVNTDDGKKALVLAKLKELTGGGTADGGGDGGDAPPDPKTVGMSHEDDDTEPTKTAGTPANAGGQGGLQPKRMTVAFAHPVIVRTVRDARKAQIDALVTQKIITPATAKELACSFCTDEQIKLELSHTGDSGSAEFERAIKLVKTVAKDRPLPKSGRSEATDLSTAIELSHQQGSDRLVKTMEKKAAQFAKK